MRRGMTLIEIMIALAIIAILFALLVPAVQKARQRAALTRSYNNLRQVVLGFQQIAAVHQGRLPGTIYSDRAFRNSAFVALLPYVERGELYEAYQKDPINQMLRLQAAVYLNPLDPSYGIRNAAISPSVGPARLSVSSYALNAQFFAFYPRMANITDGTSQTIWLTEHYGWSCNGTSFVYVLGTSSQWKPMQPATFAHGGAALGRPAPEDYYPMVSPGNPATTTAENGRTFQLRPRIEDCDPRLPNASLSRGLQVAFADGSVRLLEGGIRAEVFWALVTPSAGDDANASH